MSTTTLSIRPPVYLHTVQLLAAAWSTVTKVFEHPASAKADVAAGDVDVWKLYRMTRGFDSVQPAVSKKLSEIAAR